ncbi:MAG: sensor histidine kinase [Bacteroidota bacterium]
MINRLLAIWDFSDPVADPAVAGNVRNLVELKSRHFHELLLVTTFVAGIAFSIQDIYRGTYDQLIFSGMVAPFSSLCYLLLKKGFTLTSKILNHLTVLILPGMVQLMIIPQIGLVGFYFPILVSALITFQGREKFIAYVIATACILISGFLVFSDTRIASVTFSETELFKERLFNLISAAAITLMEVIFLLRLSNKIQSRLLAAQLDVGEKVRELSTVNKELDIRNDQLVQTNTELDNVVYRVSHDLRSPLLSVKGLLGLLQAQPGQTKEAGDYIQRALKSVGRLDETIGEILVFSRNSRKDIELEELSLKELINTIFEDLRFVAGPEFRFNESVTGADKIYYDRYRLNIILKNLVSNAVKYSRKDISAPSVTVNAVNHPDESGSGRQLLTITVTDNGKGIAPEHQSRVFDMFYRATSESVGTGLGLYICSEMVKKLNGRISLKSEVGVGTAIEVVLPRLG